MKNYCAAKAPMQNCSACKPKDINNRPLRERSKRSGLTA
jgi:hypothetical protein